MNGAFAEGDLGAMRNPSPVSPLSGTGRLVMEPHPPIRAPARKPCCESRTACCQDHDSSTGCCCVMAVGIGLVGERAGRNPAWRWAVPLPGGCALLGWYYYRRL